MPLAVICMTIGNASEWLTLVCGKLRSGKLPPVPGSKEPLASKTKDCIFLGWGCGHCFQVCSHEGSVLGRHSKRKGICAIVTAASIGTLESFSCANRKQAFVNGYSRGIAITPSIFEWLKDLLEKIRRLSVSSMLSGPRKNALVPVRTRLRCGGDSRFSWQTAYTQNDKPSIANTKHTRLGTHSGILFLVCFFL